MPVERPIEPRPDWNLFQLLFESFNLGVMLSLLAVILTFPALMLIHALSDGLLNDPAGVQRLKVVAVPVMAVILVGGTAVGLMKLRARFGAASRAFPAGVIFGVAYTMIPYIVLVLLSIFLTQDPATIRATAAQVPLVMLAYALANGLAWLIAHRMPGRANPGHAAHLAEPKSTSCME